MNFTDAIEEVEKKKAVARVDWGDILLWFDEDRGALAMTAGKARDRGVVFDAKLGIEDYLADDWYVKEGL